MAAPPSVGHPDTVLRIALSLMLTDPRAALTEAQRQWLQTRLQRTDALTAHERAKLKPTVLGWAQGLPAKTRTQLAQALNHEEA